MLLSLRFSCGKTKEFLQSFNGFSSAMKFIFFIYMPLVYSEWHGFMTAYTGTRGQTAAGIPEFSSVTTLDGQLIDYYDSNTKKLIPRWYRIKEFLSTKMWKSYTEIREKQLQIYKNNIHVLMKQFKQSDSVHTYQRMYGCEWNDETEESHGIDQHKYDGEDFISLDPMKRRYIADVEQAIPTVEKWNNDAEQLKSLKQYYNHECVYWLRKFLKLTKEDLKIKVPEVFLSQKDLSSPVKCQATGFYPSGLTFTWLRNGVNHYKDVYDGELLPNEDGSFQKSSYLRVTADDWRRNQYVCEVEHKGKTIQKILTDDEIKSNYKSYFIKLYVMEVLIILIIVAVGGYIYKKRMRGYKPVSNELDPESCESEEQIYVDKSD